MIPSPATQLCEIGIGRPGDGALLRRVQPADGQPFTVQADEHVEVIEHAGRATLRVYGPNNVLRREIPATVDHGGPDHEHDITWSRFVEKYHLPEYVEFRAGEPATAALVRHIHRQHQHIAAIEAGRKCQCWLQWDPKTADQDDDR